MSFCVVVFHLRLVLPSGLLILYALLIFPVSAIHPVRLISLHLITLIIFNEEYRVSHCVRLTFSVLQLLPLC
jgi:hypothetical protein